MTVRKRAVGKLGLVFLFFASWLKAAEPVMEFLSQAVQAHIDRGEVAGVVSLVATPGRIVHVAAAGHADIANKVPLSADSLFWIASMTKPVTACAVMMLQDEGKLEESAVPALYDCTRGNDRYPPANGGLYSTAADYGRFCQMLLNRGTFGGKQYLTPAAVSAMSTVHSGDLKTGFTEGNGWGLGCGIVRQPQGVTAMLSPGTFGHGGAYGTQAWIDPVKKVAYVLMVQRTNFVNGDASDLRRDFQNAAANGLELMGQ